MNPIEYQQRASRTLLDKPGFQLAEKDFAQVWIALRIATALGDIIEVLKKGIFHRDPAFNRDDFAALYSIFRMRFRTSQNEDYSSLYNRLLGRPPDIMILWNITGLVGESLELAKVIMTYLVLGKTTQEEIIKETGDCLWYLTAICSKMGISLVDVMIANIRKLEERYPNGFTAEDSARRVDVTASGNSI